MITKLLLFVILLTLSLSLNAFEIETGACEGFHLTGSMALYIISDICSERLEIPPYLPVLFVTGVGIAKECFDANFSLRDLQFDMIGIGLGFCIRFADRKQRR